MKEFEIHFRDLTEEAQIRLMESFGTCEEDENWDVEPLAIIEREEGI